MDEPNTRAPSGQGRQSVVFVVDDEGVIATTLGMILIQMGFSVRTFVDPVEALRAAESSAPDILLADVVMPGMNGIELAAEIRRHSPICEVLLISGEIVTEELLAEARPRGYDFEVVPKPVHPNTLLEMITKMLKK